jgi:hypothetical protein
VKRVKGSAAPSPLEPFTLSRLERLEGEKTFDQILTTDYPAYAPLPLLTRLDTFYETASHLFAGEPKVGKTSLLRYLCHGWALDGKKILYLSEEPYRMWKDRALKWDLGPIGNDCFRVFCGLGAEPEDLLRRAAGGDEDIVVIDSTRTMMGITSMANSDAAAPVFKKWTHAISGGPAKTVVFSHHLNKDGETISGGQGLLAVVDSLITYKAHTPDSPLRLVHVNSRLGDEPFDFGIRKVGSQVEILDRLGTLTLTDAERDVYVSLDPAEPRTLETLMAATNFAAAKVRRVINSLVAKGLARDVSGNAGVGGKGKKAAYILTDEVDDA